MQKLKEIRKAKNISQQEIAKLINTNQESISRLERGNSTINNVQIKILCEYLNISADELLDIKLK